MLKVIDSTGVSDFEVAETIRKAIKALNDIVEVAAARELIVAYRIKDGVKTDGLTNPRIIVSVMTEVA